MRKFRTILSALVISFLWFSSAELDAQCYGNNAPVNEIGFRLGSVTDASNLGGIQLANRSASVAYLNGIHYKRYGTYGAFRASLGIERYEHEERTGCPNCFRTDGKVSGMKLRAGYETFAMLGQIEPFIGVDAVLGFDSYDGETYSLNSTEYSEMTDKRSRRGFGLGPVAGIRVYLSYAISISAETSVEAMFWGRTTTISEISPEASVVSKTSNYFETTFQPLNWLSLNVMF